MLTTNARAVRSPKRLRIELIHQLLNVRQFDLAFLNLARVTDA